MPACKRETIGLDFAREDILPIPCAQAQLEQRTTVESKLVLNTDRSQRPGSGGRAGLLLGEKGRRLRADVSMTAFLVS